MLQDFLASNYERHPSGLVPVAAIRRAYLGTLPDDERPLWNRSRLIAELGAIGLSIVSYRGVQHVAGILPAQVQI